MRYRIYMSVDLEARDDREAHENALKLSEMLKSPMLKMAVAAEGVQLAGEPVVYQPQRHT